MNKKTKKRTLSMALAAALAFSPVQAFAASSDIAGHWAEDVITQWENAGKISGYEDGTFRPNNSVTRAEFVIMMNNALGLTEAGEVSFSDVQPGNWFYNAVAIAVAAGYCSGYEDGTFKPSATITRAEAAVMIANASKLEQDATGAAGFTDSIPAWAQGSVGAVVNAGFMSGYPDGTFAANQSITRAEAVSSLNRVIGGVTANDVVVTEATEIADQTIEGNLIIDAALTDGTVTVKNTTVTGNIVVRGGAADALKLDGVTVEGKLIVEKEGAEVVLTGETKVPSVEISALSTLSADNFKGSVGTVTIKKNLDTAKTVKLSVPADKVVLDGTAAVDVNEDVTAVEVTKNAEGSKVYVNSGATVDTVVADAKVAVSGSGTVKLLEVNADDVTVSTSLKVNKTEVAEGVKEPTTTTGGGGGGGGGGSSSSTDDDEVGQYSTFPVKDDASWEKAVNAAATNKYGRLQIIIAKDAKFSTKFQGTETLTYNGNGNLIVDCQNPTVLDNKTITINAPNAANIYLKDGGVHNSTPANDAGVSLTTLTIDASKATVDCNWAATDIKVAAVSNATLNVKDEVTTVTIAKGSVNLQNGGKTAVVVDTVAPQAADVVTVKGKMKSLSVNAAADVTIAGTVDGAQITSGSARKITVANGANVTGALTTSGTVEYAIAGGTVANLTVPTGASGAIAISGGTVKALDLQTGATSKATVTGGTVQTATVAAGTLTVDNGSVASVDFQGGTLNGKGTVDTVTAANGTTVGVQNVGTVKTNASATAVTINSTNVGMVETNNTSETTLTLGTNTQIGTLVADKGPAKLGANGKVNNIVATKKVTVDNAKQVTGSITVANGGTVVDSASKVVDTVTKTEITDVKLADDSKVKRDYYKGEEIDLSGLTLTVTQTTTEPGGQASAATPKTVSYEEIKSLVTVEGFQKNTVGTYKNVEVNYAGFTVELTGTFTVNLTQEDWANAAKTALAQELTSTVLNGVTEVAVNVKDEIELPKTLAFADGTGTANVAWSSSDKTFVDVTTYGDDFKATVLKNVRDEQKPVTLTATLTSGSYTTSVVYTLKINAPNQGAMNAWSSRVATVLTGDVIEIKVNPETYDPTTEKGVTDAIKNYLSTKDISSVTESTTTYTLTVAKVEKSGNNWNATLNLEATNPANADDAVENVVTFSVVDQAAGAKVELAKLEKVMPTSIVVASNKYNDVATVNEAIAAKLQAVLGTGSNYIVTANGQLSDQNAEKKTSTWKGTVTVAHTDSMTNNDTATSKDQYTVSVSEGMDITLGEATITGNTDKLDGTPEVKLTAGNATFDTTKVKVDADVTKWFTNLPTGLVATVKEVGADAKTVTVSFAWSEDTSVAHGTTKDAEKLKVSVDSEYFTDAKATLTTEGPATIQIAQAQKNVEVPNVSAKDGNDRVSITLSKDSSATFDNTSDGTPATNIKNYTFNNKIFEGTATVSDDKKTVTIKLDKGLEKDTTYTIGINAAVFAEGAVVEPKDVDVKYYTAQKDVEKTDLTLRDGATALFVELPEGKAFAEGIESKAASFTLTPDSGVTINSVAFVGEAKNKVKLTFATSVSGQKDNVTLTIKADALADPENVVTAADVTAESRILLAKGAITKVNLVDKREPAFDTVCGTNTAELVGEELKEDAPNQVTVTTAELRYHKNGNGDFGYWSGFGVEAPQGATGMKYQFATTEAGLETLNDSPALDVDIDGTGKNGIAFFIDAFPTNDEVTKFVAVQFYDASGAMTPVYKFEMNLDAVEKANQGVTVAAKADQDYVIADGTITGGETDKITTATTVQDFKDTLKASDSADTDNNVSTGAEIKVVDKTTADGITTAAEFKEATDKTGNMEDGVVVVVLSQDLSKIGRYTVNVEAGA